MKTGEAEWTKGEVNAGCHPNDITRPVGVWLSE